MTNEMPGTTSPTTPPPTGDVHLPLTPPQTSSAAETQGQTTSSSPPLVSVPPVTPSPSLLDPAPAATSPVAAVATPVVPAVVPVATTPTAPTPPTPASPAMTASAAPVATPPTAAPPSSPPASQPSTKKNTPFSTAKAKLILPVLALFVLVVGGGAAFFLSQRQQNIQNQASAVTSRGQVEALSCTQIRGWLCDSANFAQSLRVAVYLNEFREANLISTFEANINRADISDQCGGTSNHGFVIDLPSDRIPAGQQRLIVKGIPVGANGQLNTADMFDIPLATGVSNSLTCGAASAVCTVAFNVKPAPESSIACSKTSFQDELANSAGQYSYRTEKTSFEPGEVVVFRVTLRNTGELVQQFQLTDVLNTNNLEQLDFLDTNCGTYNAATRTISWSTNPVAGGDQVICGFRARVKSSVRDALVMTNTAQVTAGSLTTSCTAPISVVIPGSSPSPSPSPSVSPSPSPTPSPTVSPSPSPSPSPSASPEPFCGMNCSNTNQCPLNHVCTNGRCVLFACSQGVSCTANQCRVTSCRSSCSTTDDCPFDHTCRNSVCILNACDAGAPCDADQCTVLQTRTVVVNQVVNQTQVVSQPGQASQPAKGEEPVRAAACNQSCQSNADCQESSHICVDTAQGRRCRLDSNVSSTTCTPAGQAPAVATPMPQDLPVAGSNDLLKAFGVGAVAVILGMIGLILL